MERLLAPQGVPGLPHLLVICRFERQYHTEARLAQLKVYSNAKLNCIYLSHLCYVFSFVVEFLDYAVKSRRDLPCINQNGFSSLGNNLIPP